MKTYALLILLLTGGSVYAQTDSTIVRPSLIFKFLPTSLLSIDPNIQFQLEYFIGKQSSLEGGYGFGNNRIFNERSNIKTNVLRLEYKYYLRPFTQKRRGANYVAGEVMYKHVLQNKSAIGFDEIDDRTASVPFTLDGNDVAPRIKFGRTWFTNSHHVFNIYAGLGVMFKNNFSDDMPEDTVYDISSLGNGMFSRSLGKRLSLSPTIGVSLGFGGLKK